MPTPAFPRKTRGRLSSLTLAALAVAAPHAGAQTAPADTPSAGSDTLAPVVVTASRREQLARSAPATVSVVTREELEAKPYTSVVDVLRTVEGVSVVGSNPNDQDIALRGMPGEYTLILVDGQRQNTRETMNRGTGGVQANLLPPLAAIERIEVVRGPMSSLYGADAMGGVINIITRKQPRAWHGTVAATAVWQQEEGRGDRQGLEFWAGGPLVGETLGLQLSGRTARREEDDLYYPANATSGANGQRDNRLEAKLSARLAPNQDLRLDLGREVFSYLASAGKSIADTPAATTDVKTRHRRDHAELTHDGRWGWGRSTVSLTQETEQQTRWTYGGGLASAAPQIRNTQLEGRAVLPWGGGDDTLTVGAQVRRERLSDVATQDAVPSGYAPNTDEISRRSWAVFAENDHAFSPSFTLTAGARLDHDERFGSRASPRLYGVYQLDPAWTLRGGVATGFKAPTLRQSAGGYCMTTGGAAGATPGTLCGNPDLKPETSVTEEIGLRRDLGGDFLAATLFNSTLRNKVYSYDTGVADAASPGRNVYAYENISRVKLYGAELSGGAALAPRWRLGGSYTFTQSRRSGGGETAFGGSSLDGRPLDKTPRHKAHVQVDWQVRERVSLYLAGDYVGKQYWAAYRNSALNVRERPATATADLGGRIGLARGVDLKLAVQNLTNRIVAVDPRSRTGGLNGNWLVDEGRRLAATLSAEF
jgi:outer membrane receptor for ferrienterochelin and colicins